MFPLKTTISASPFSIPLREDPSVKICKSVGPSAPIVSSAEASCWVGDADFRMRVKWIGGWGGSGHGILEICTCYESAGVRLREDKMGAVVFFQSSLLRRFGQCVCISTLLSSLGGKWIQSSAFLRQAS